jgi:hypothetical protein
MTILSKTAQTSRMPEEEKKNVKKYVATMTRANESTSRSWSGLGILATDEPRIPMSIIDGLMMSK